MIDTLFRVSEIFSSIDGEGIRAGCPVTFIRLHGCNCSCSYCDSTYATEGDDYTLMSMEEIINEVYNKGFFRGTLTGGEPLNNEFAYDLVLELRNRGYEVNIETNGSFPIDRFSHLNNTIITMDYKCYSSGMTDKMDVDNFMYLRRQDVLKFVVGDINDLNQMRDILNQYRIYCNVFVSPVFGKIDPKDIVTYLLDNNLENVRLQLQMHKIIWDPNMRGV